MGGVVPRLIKGCVDTAANGAVPTETFFEGLPVQYDDLADSQGLVDWRIFVEVFERMTRACGGLAELAAVQEPLPSGFRQFGVLAEALRHPALVYRLLSVTGRLCLPSLSIEFEEYPDHVHIVTEIPGCDAGSLPLMHGIMGSHRGALAAWCGGELAEVELIATERRSSLRVFAPGMKHAVEDVGANPVALAALEELEYGCLTFLQATDPERALIGDPFEERAARAAVRWRLTPGQSRVLRHVAWGATNKEVAATLGCAEGTIELHVTQLLRKASVDVRGRLIAAFWSM